MNTFLVNHKPPVDPFSESRLNDTRFDDVFGTSRGAIADSSPIHFSNEQVRETFMLLRTIAEERWIADVLGKLRLIIPGGGTVELAADERAALARALDKMLDNPTGFGTDPSMMAPVRELQQSLRAPAHC